jgi:hypothetical protein
MAEGVTKNPQFATDEEIKKENERRKKSIEQFQKMPVEQIWGAIQCTLDGAVGKALSPPPGELLYVRKTWLIRPDDVQEHYKLMVSRATMMNRSGYGLPTETLKAIDQKLDAIYRRGSDYLRAAVAKAASWTGVPGELLAAVLQNENSPKATGGDRTLQGIERSVQSFFGVGSTGFGNVKPDTLDEAKGVFRKFYHWPILGAGVKDVDQNDNTETDIYHAAAVLRDGLNKAWSAGARSLNKDEFKKYEYYPYFGGTVTEDVATRAIGHYNGWGDGAKKYGEDGLRRIQKQQLYFLPQK